MRLTLALCLMLLTTPLGAGAQERTTLGPAPILGGGSYSTGGGITVAVEPRRTTDGRLALCGVYAESRQISAYVRGKAPRILATASLAVDGVPMLSNLRFLAQTDPAESYAGTEAACAVTPRAHTGAERVEIRIPRQLVVRERGGGGGNLEIGFGPAKRENPALGAGSLLPERWSVFRGNPDRDTSRERLR